MVPDPEEGYLDDVTRLLAVAQHAVGELQQRPRLARHEGIEGGLVAVGDRQQQLAVAGFRKPLASRP